MKKNSTKKLYTAANMSILKTGKAKMILKKISFLRGMDFG